MIEIGDILTSGFDVRKVIDIEDDYCVGLLLENIDGPIDQDEDNIAEFILLNDIYDNFKGV